MTTVATTPTPALLADAAAVHRALDVRATRDAVEAAFRDSALPGAVPPSTAGLHAPQGTFHVKSAINAPESPGATRYFVAKVNANFPANPVRHGLPTIQGVLVLFDGDRGVPLAVMDSGSVTVLRTAAATGVAVKHLALPGASRLAIVGCGAQAQAQLAAVRDVRPIDAVVVFDANPAASERLVRHASESLGLRALVAPSVRHAVRDAAIVVTTTTATAPILQRGDIAPGALVAAVGADNPGKQEIEAGLMASAVVVTDRTEQCAEIGDLHHAITAGAMTRADVRAELGAVVADPSRGRRSPDEVIVFDSTGLAFQDVAAAALVYDRLRADRATQSFAFAGLAPSG